MSTGRTLATRASAVRSQLSSPRNSALRPPLSHQARCDSALVVLRADTYSLKFRAEVSVRRNAAPREHVPCVNGTASSDTSVHPHHITNCERRGSADGLLNGTRMTAKMKEENCGNATLKAVRTLRPTSIRQPPLPPYLHTADTAVTSDLGGSIEQKSPSEQCNRRAVMKDR
ncbi:hypothetical protein F2P81_004811 [Scophthalmus maximus]|uniref:Uncharacterized protein n=1 Tax=Scophthalmus maximus TaxID=52904 RepID=A0A6A4TJS6_SCOMX|nr:hypothetical protein F2P81_004811 [Scophthalmus maximus]